MTLVTSGVSSTRNVEIFASRNIRFKSFTDMREPEPEMRLLSRITLMIDATTAPFTLTAGTTVPVAARIPPLSCLLCVCHGG